MRLIHIVPILALAAAAAACQDQPVSNVRSPNGPAADLGTDSMQITLTPSTTWQSSAGTFSVSATVNGGTGPYYFRWHYRYCENRTGTKYCDNTWRQFNQGSGLTTVSHMMYSTDMVQDIYADVADAQGYPVTSSDTTTVYGPIDDELVAVVPAYTLVCNLPAGYYPFQGSVFQNGQWVNKNYRRNPCTNAREYNPN